MKSKLYLFEPVNLKTAMLMLVSIIGFTAMTTCSAQSIVGKWNQLKIKTYYTAEGAKANGNHTESEINISTIGTAVFVFYSNNTYRMETTTGDSKVSTFLGTWTLAGNLLTMQLLAQQEDPKNNPKKGTPPEKTAMTINGNIMEWTTVYTDNATISKIVLTFARNS